MSVVSNRHLFVEFKSGESKPFAEQRLARVLYKPKSGKISHCVSIPKLSDAVCERIHNAFPISPRDRAEEFQDKLIKALFESGVSEITSEEIGESQIVAFVEATSSSDRLSKEMILEWWKQFADIAKPVLSEKYKTEDEKILEQKANAWRDAFCSLTGRGVINVQRIGQLEEMLGYADEDDSIAVRLTGKLAEMRKELESLDSL